MTFPTRFGRRQFLTGAAAVASAAVAGCQTVLADRTRPSDVTEWPPEPLEGSLTFWTWHNYWADWAEASFKYSHDLNSTSRNVYGVPSEWLEEVRRRDHATDVVHSTTRPVERALAADLLEPLPARLMPAWEEVTGRFDLARYQRDGDVYALPQTWTLFPLQYNLNEFDDAPKSWDVLWDDAYADRIVMKDDAVVSCQIAALYTGQDPANPSDFDDIRAALQQQRPLVHRYWSNRYNARRLFERERVLLGPLTQAATCLCAEDKAPIRWTVPTEGTMSTHSVFVIPRGAPNPKTALRFIDWGLRRKITTTDSWDDDWDLHFSSRLSEAVADRYDAIWSDVRAE